MSDEGNGEVVRSDFVREMIAADVAAGKHDGRVVTRFPPEPNGFLHIGHARAICLNFSVAEEFGGHCTLRFDDTNPTAEEDRYVRAIEEDVRWLGFDWGEHRRFASDYFEALYEYALDLIRRGKAFVCDLSPETMREYNGTLTEPGRPSPHRDRSVEENLDLFRRMRAGEFEAGARVLRAKIDLASSVLPMRDPILYRIQHATHHRTGDAWTIYPLYDFAHCLSDAIEGVTHSLCTLEFTDHRPLYDWVLAQLDTPSDPEQTEFARLNLSHTVLSKRALRRLVEEDCVEGWDDPRMPTLSGLRRRGVPPEAIRAFCDDVGLSKRDNLIELSRLEFHVREKLNQSAPRVMAVLKPLRVVLMNYPEDASEHFIAVNNPEDPSAGERQVPFSRVLYIERDDFLEDPPKKFFRLAPGREVRLRYACLITCEEVIKDEDGEIVELRCRFDPESRGGNAPDGRRVKATLHWVSAEHAVPLRARLLTPLFDVADPASEEGDLLDYLSDASWNEVEGFAEPSLASATPGTTCQFERLGYFAIDPDSSGGAIVANRSVTLRDAWSREKKKKPVK